MAQALYSGTILHNTYRIERVLGQGGFGITYLAIDMNLDRLVAVKEFFPKDFCDRPADTNHMTLGTQSTAEFINRLKTKFIKEAKNIARFDDPGIIRIHAAFEENNTAYYVMDFIEGESLWDKVKREGPLSETQAVDYITKVGEALEFVHGYNMNHLDVKPANIMIRKRDNRPILIDFGLAKQYDTDGLQTSTTPTGISHGFAPMEQYTNGGVREFSPQTDLYALAATLYYLLSGEIPPQATMLIDDELTFPPTIPQRLIDPIAKAMSAARKNRHATIGEFLRQIRTVPGINVKRAAQTEVRAEETVFPKKKDNRIDSDSKKGTESPAKTPRKWPEPVGNKNENEMSDKSGLKIVFIAIATVILIGVLLAVFRPFASSDAIPSADSEIVDCIDSAALDSISELQQNDWADEQKVVVEEAPKTKTPKKQTQVAAKKSTEATSKSKENDSKKPALPSTAAEKIESKKNSQKGPHDILLEGSPNGVIKQKKENESIMDQKN